jgi:hypothetical protein
VRYGFLLRADLRSHEISKWVASLGAGRQRIFRRGEPNPPQLTSVVAKLESVQKLLSVYESYPIHNFLKK